MKNNKLAYVTYQTFPASTANSLQTICNITEIANKDSRLNWFSQIETKRVQIILMN